VEFVAMIDVDQLNKEFNEEERYLKDLISVSVDHAKEIKRTKRILRKMKENKLELEENN